MFRDDLVLMEQRGDHRLVDLVLAGIEINESHKPGDLRTIQERSEGDFIYDIYDEAEKPEAELEEANEYGTRSSRLGNLRLGVVSPYYLSEWMPEALEEIGRSGEPALVIDWLGLPPQLGAKYMFSVIKMIGELMDRFRMPLVFEAKQDTSFRFLQSPVVQRYIREFGYQISDPIRLYRGTDYYHVIAIG